MTTRPQGTCRYTQTHTQTRAALFSSLPSLLFTALFAALLAAPLPAAAQAWPARSIRIIEPYPPGGVLDNLVRAVGTRLAESLGQPVVVDNRPGGNAIIGLDACAKAPPDGYTICMTTNDSISFNPFLFSKMPFDPAKDLAPVARLAWVDGVIVTQPAVPAKNLREMLALAKQKPGAFNWGSFGNGSSSHLYLGMINKAAGTEIVHVPYKGSAPLMQAMLGGEVQLTFLATGILMPQIKAGKLVPLAVAGSSRLPALPDTPTLAESGIDFHVRTWFGTFAPAATPPAIVERLNAEIGKILSDPAFDQQSLARQGFRSAHASTREFAEFLKQDREAGAKLVSNANVRLD